MPLARQATCHVGDAFQRCWCLLSCAGCIWMALSRGFGSYLPDPIACLYALLHPPLSTAISPVRGGSSTAANGETHILSLPNAARKPRNHHPSDSSSVVVAEARPTRVASRNQQALERAHSLTLTLALAYCAHNTDGGAVQALGGCPWHPLGRRCSDGRRQQFARRSPHYEPGRTGGAR